jgi:ATP-binding cassette, subfamily C, type I secretion system permease/ATPase
LVETLKRLRQQGVTVICVAQRPELVLQADYILRVSHGLVDGFGPREEILSRAMRAAAVAEVGARTGTAPTQLTVAGGAQ